MPDTDEAIVEAMALADLHVQFSEGAAKIFADMETEEWNDSVLFARRQLATHRAMIKAEKDLESQGES